MILNFAKLLIEKGITDNKEDIKKVFVYALPVADMFDIKEIKDMSITTDGKNIFIEELDNFNDDFKDIKANEAYMFYDAFEGMVKFNDDIVDAANELCAGLCEVAVKCNSGKITTKLANEYIAYYKVFFKFRETENKPKMFKKIKKVIILPPACIHEIYQRIVNMKIIEAVVVRANSEFIRMHDTRRESYLFEAIPAIYGGVLSPIMIFEDYYLKDNPVIPESDDLCWFVDKGVIDILVKHNVIKKTVIKIRRYR